MNKVLMLLTLSTFIYGCATAHRINSVSVGMNKNEVIKAVGQPASISAKGNSEYLNYRFSETDDHAFIGITTPYYVRLVNGKVDSYGRMGDFDSTKTPTVRIEKDETIKANINTESKKDLYSELKKLKELKDEGILTQIEFEKEKKKLLSKY